MPLSEEEKRKRKNESQKRYIEANKERIKEKLKESVKKYRDANKERIKEYHKEWTLTNKEKLKEYKKEYDQTEVGKKVGTISTWKKRKIFFKDKEESEFYYETYINTHNCSWCDIKFINSKDRCLDHCHLCGLPRAIICRQCNLKDLVPCFMCLLQN